MSDNFNILDGSIERLAKQEEKILSDVKESDAMDLTKKLLDQKSTDELINLCYKQLNLKKEDANALKFTNVLVQLAEEQLTRQLIELFKKCFAKTSKPDIMEMFMRDMYWTKKINLINAIDEKRFKLMISFLRKMNDIRNKVFHAKFSELKYKGKNISDIGTQRDMIFDYIKANITD